MANGLENSAPPSLNQVNHLVSRRNVGEVDSLIARLSASFAYNMVGTYEETSELGLTSQPFSDDQPARITSVSPYCDERWELFFDGTAGGGAIVEGGTGVVASTNAIRCLVRASTDCL